jgi:hypothetical protein
LRVSKARRPVLFTADLLLVQMADEDASSRRRTVAFAERGITFVSREGLTAMKRAAGRYPRSRGHRPTRRRVREHVTRPRRSEIPEHELNLRLAGLAAPGRFLRSLRPPRVLGSTDV